jgi:pimeloyl-ACP methyl ester carboxylesterase
MVGTTKVGFVAGGYLTPHLAARTAAKLWCKVPRTAGRRKDNRPWTGRVGHFDVAPGRRAVVEEWGPASGPLVYLVHGWGGWRGQVASFVPPLVDAGCHVVAFDSLSHGDSDPGEHGPNHSSGGELGVTLEALAAAYGPADAVIGHSLGCAAAARAVLEDKLEATRLVMVAPSPDMAEAARNFCRILAFPERTTRLMLQASAAWAHRDLDEFTIPVIAESGKLPPGLVIHDRADKESRYRTALDIDAAWDNATLMTTEGYGHHRILIAPEVIAAAARAATAKTL